MSALIEGRELTKRFGSFVAVDGKPKRSTDLLRLANVRAHDRVSLLVDHYDDDWASLWWVRLDGVAEVVIDGTEHEAAIGMLAAKYPQYRSMQPNGPVLRVTVSGLAHWEAASGI